MPPELFGMGVAARHPGGGRGYARIRLPQPDALPTRQAVEPLDGRMQELGSVGKVMAFGCTVVSTVTLLRSRLRNAPASCARSTINRWGLPERRSPAATWRRRRGKM